LVLDLQTDWAPGMTMKYGPAPEPTAVLLLERRS
jgi:hypothetical protein